MQIYRQLKEFSEFNSSQCNNPQILWECFIRGVYIAFSSKLKASRSRRMTEFENDRTRGLPWRGNRKKSSKNMEIKTTLGKIFNECH